MALITSNTLYLQTLQTASGSAHSLPLKLGLTLWSGCQRVTTIRSSRIALSAFSNPSRSWNGRYCSSQSLMRPGSRHGNAQLPLMVSRITSSLPRIIVHGNRRSYYERSDQGQVAGDKFYAFVSSSSPTLQDIKIIRGGDNLDAVMAPLTPGNSNEPATKTDSSRPNTSPKIPPKSASSGHSSSDVKFSLVEKLLFWGPIWCVVAWYVRGWERENGAQKLRAELPDAEIYFKRKVLLEKEEELKGRIDNCTITHQKKTDIRNFMDSVRALDRQEREHLLQRVMALNEKLETQKASVEMEGPTNTLLEALTEEPLPLNLCIDLASRRSKKRATFEISPLTHSDMSEKVCSQKVEAAETAKSVPHEDDSTAHIKPDTNLSSTPTTKTGQIPASKTLETLAAEKDATNEEMSQIKRAKEFLKSREKELEAESKKRKKRIQELNAPKSDQIWPVVRGMLFGSALAFGVSVLRNAT